jgi:DNA-binding CsgD family transcriptional regulator
VTRGRCVANRYFKCYSAPGDIRTDPVLPIDVEPEVLAKLYGLTRREADLAVQLSAGLELRAAATAAGMSYNTARSHIRLLFRKTGAKSQLQLVSVLRGLASLH